MRVLVAITTIWAALEGSAAVAQPKKLLYATQPVMEQGTEGLLPRVQDQIARNIGPSLEGRTFESYWSMRDRVSGTGDELRSLSTYTGHDYLNAARVQATALRNRKVERLLRVDAFRTAAGLLSIRVDLYEVPSDPRQNPRLLRSKWVAPCGVPEETALDQLGEAIRCLASTCNHAPRAAVEAPAHEINVGEEVILDACASGDPDYDAVQWEWSDAQGTWRGRNLTRRFSEPGVHVVKLTVRSVTEPTAVAEQELALHVIAAPVARAGPPRKLEAESGPVVVSLDGSASRNAEGAEFEWQQLSGPIGHWPESERMSCAAVTCNFTAPSSGAYEFRLTVRNGALVSTDETMVLINPTLRPGINAYGRSAMFPRNTIKLSAVIDASELDQQPLASWRVERKSPEFEWEEAHDVILGSPSALTTSFTPQREGRYRVTLSTRGRKSSGARELWGSGETTYEVNVLYPVGFLYTDVMAGFPSGSDGVATTLTPRIHLLGMLPKLAWNVAFGAGVYDLDRGFGLDIEGSVVFGRRVGFVEIRDFFQTVPAAGIWVARRDDRNRIEQGVQISLTSVIRPLKRIPVIQEWTARVALDEDDIYFQIGFALGLARPFEVE